MMRAETRESASSDEVEQPVLLYRPPPLPEWFPLSQSFRHDSRTLWEIPLILSGLGVLALASDIGLARSFLIRPGWQITRQFVEAMEAFGHSVSVIVLCVAIFHCHTAKRWAFWRTLVCSLGAGVFADVVKFAVGRTRPHHSDLFAPVWKTFHYPFSALWEGSGTQGCPSAHVATAAGLTVMMSILFPRGRWIFITIAALVAMQRIEAGAHFLSDTFWGAAVGCVWSFAWLTPTPWARLFDRFDRWVAEGQTRELLASRDELVVAELALPAVGLLTPSGLASVPQAEPVPCGIAETGPPHSAPVTPAYGRTYPHLSDQGDSSVMHPELPARGGSTEPVEAVSSQFFESAGARTGSPPHGPHALSGPHATGIANETPRASAERPLREEPDTLPCRFDGTPLRSCSVIVPMHNERDNVRPLYEALRPVLDGLGLPWEVVCVDDGSFDGTDRELAELAGRDSRVKVLHFRKNFGQTAALRAGMEAATGDAFVLMDGDLQNDPADIPRMLEKLEEGYDVVHGWRKERHDRFLDRRLPSLLANWLIARVTNFPVHDLGCTLKALRRDVAGELDLWGEMHRFIPILAHIRGARCVEVVTTHHPRRFGQSKYGISRTLRVLLDLCTIKFQQSYLHAPMRLFGHLGLACWSLATVGGGALALLGLPAGAGAGWAPVVCALASLLLLFGVQFFALGLLLEVSVRAHRAASHASPFAIRRARNLGGTSPASAAEPDPQRTPGTRPSRAA